MKKKGSPTAPFVSKLSTRFRIIHPFHPLYGKEYELVDYRNSWRKVCVEFLNEQGSTTTVPLEWTDAAGIDPFIELADGRVHFRIKDLVQLVDLVAELLAKQEDEARRGVKEKTPSRKAKDAVRDTRGNGSPAVTD